MKPSFNSFPASCLVKCLAIWARALFEASSVRPFSSFLKVMRSVAGRVVASSPVAIKSEPLDGAAASRRVTPEMLSEKPAARGEVEDAELMRIAAQALRA